ncbi:hypothetical protein ACWIUD_02555 [Helicobacter sp. 23-1044]
MQPFCEKETSEFNPKNGENIADSANETKIAESRIKTQNLFCFVIARHEVPKQSKKIIIWIATKSPQVRLLAMTKKSRKSQNLTNKTAKISQILRFKQKLQNLAMTDFTLDSANQTQFAESRLKLAESLLIFEIFRLFQSLNMTI